MCWSTSKFGPGAVTSHRVLVAQALHEPTQLVDETIGFVVVELWQQAGGAFAGTPAEVREFIADEVEVAGLDTMNLHMAFGDISYDNVCRTAELFAAEVRPAFAEVGARP